MKHATSAAAEATTGETRQERERQHYNRRAERLHPATLQMSRWNIERYRNPPEATVFPLEYAFHLLGNVSGKTIVDLGCGDGLNTVILASLGAKVLAVDISDKSLAMTYHRAQANGVASNVTALHSDAAGIPIQDNEADAVLCAAILHHVDIPQTVRCIRRILRPGGIAVFEEPMAGPDWLCTLKKVLPRNPGRTVDEQPLTLDQVRLVSTTVGRQGRSRYFGMMLRITDRLPFTSFEFQRFVHHCDAIVLKMLPFTKAFASPLVWEARKD